MKRTLEIKLTNMYIVKNGEHSLVIDKMDSEFEKSITFLGGHVEPSDPIQNSVSREIKELYFDKQEL